MGTFITRKEFNQKYNKEIKTLGELDKLKDQLTLDQKITLYSCLKVVNDFTDLNSRQLTLLKSLKYDEEIKDYKEKHS